jgi:NitT/TauT family transport system ATP-binding protein
MDEPFAALDAQLREELQVELRRIQSTDTKTIIFVTHDVEEAVFLAGRVIVFSPRPACISADIDVGAILGPTRDLDSRDGRTFFELRTEILHMLRAGRTPRAA